MHVCVSIYICMYMYNKYPKRNLESKGFIGKQKKGL